MGSVIDYIDCPNCGHEAYNDFYYKTGEEYVNCQNCGYHYSAVYKTDDEGKYITQDGTENYTFDNLIMETKEIKNPYGAYRIRYVDSIGYHCGSLENESDYEELKLTASLNENGAMEHVAINRYINGEIIEEILIDGDDEGPKFDGAGFSEEDRVAE
jgi:DNA-directed RNA polymerase subunit RPC12/RpoP